MVECPLQQPFSKQLISLPPLLPPFSLPFSLPFSSHSSSSPPPLPPLPSFFSLPRPDCGAHPVAGDGGFLIASVRRAAVAGDGSRRLGLACGGAGRRSTHAGFSGACSGGGVGEPGRQSAHGWRPGVLRA